MCPGDPRRCLAPAVRGDNSKTRITYGLLIISPSFPVAHSCLLRVSWPPRSLGAEEDALPSVPPPEIRVLHGFLPGRVLVCSALQRTDPAGLSALAHQRHGGSQAGLRGGAGGRRLFRHPGTPQAAACTRWPAAPRTARMWVRGRGFWHRSCVHQPVAWGPGAKCKRKPGVNY